MSILEKLPDDQQREIELLREVIKAKDALIAELSKRPIASPPVYVPYPTYPSYPTWPWEPPYRVTCTTSATSGSISIKGTLSGKSDGTTWTVVPT